MYPNGYLVPNSRHTVAIMLNDFISTVAYTLQGGAKSCSSLQLGNASGLYPLLWRFLPVLDPQISLCFSRDLDSQLGERELAAVMEFVKSPEASVSNSSILTS